MTAAWCEASLDPSCCCKVQHSRREMGEALHSRGAALPAHRKHSFISEIIPQNLSLYSCCIQMRLQQLQASQKTLICSKLIHKMLNNSLSLQYLTTSTNRKSQGSSGKLILRNCDTESDELEGFCCSSGAAFKGLAFCLSKTH